MDMQLTNKKALVTGSTGDRLRHRLTLAQEGASVVVNGRRSGASSRPSSAPGREKEAR